jgi:hypothetical protein
MQEDLIEQELPPRPRRRLLSPVPIALLCVLLSACGFVGGVLVEKGEGSSTSGASAGGGSGGFASRLAALRSGGADASGARGGGGAAAALFAGGGAGGGGRGGATIGQVAYTSGRALYVTDSEGNTIKVTTSTASAVTKTVKSDVKAIHPGETVIVTGSAGAGGAVKADSIRVSEAGAGGAVKADSIRVSEAGAGGALGALFGGGGGSGLAGRARAGGGEAGGGGAGGSAGGAGEGPVLFGK